MSNIRHYWNDKIAMGQQAKRHTIAMQEQYALQIAETVRQTKAYGVAAECPVSNAVKFNSKMNIIVEDIDSVSAIMQFGDKKTAALNFASYKNPGGMFIKGSCAQEESLCHSSFLYNVLKEETAYYDWNNNNKNCALYKNRALYSPDVLFFNDINVMPCDVITCAAPNRSAALNYGLATEVMNFEALASRIKFVIDIARVNQVNTLILGAFGCGVFGQEASTVARLFQEALDLPCNHCFDTVVFAIPSGRDKNLQKFKEIFDKGAH